MEKLINRVTISKSIMCIWANCFTDIGSLKNLEFYNLAGATV